MSKRTGNTSVSSTGIQSLESKSAVHRPPQASTQESTLSFGDVLRKYRLLKKQLSQSLLTFWEFPETRSSTGRATKRDPTFLRFRRFVYIWTFLYMSCSASLGIPSHISPRAKLPFWMAIGNSALSTRMLLPRWSTRCWKKNKTPATATSSTTFLCFRWNPHLLPLVLAALSQTHRQSTYL